LRAKYYPQGNLIDTVFTGNPSSSWTAISYGVELLKKGIIWRVGNGLSIRVWRDNWIPRSTHFKPYGTVRRSRIRRVSELLDEYGAWREQKIRDIFRPVDAEAILAIRTSPRLEADFLAWQPEMNGIFTVRSAYRLGLKFQTQGKERGASSAAPEGDKPVWRKIWQCQVPEKVRIFAWKAVSNGLATEDNKLRRHMKVSGRCRICDHELEDVDHALFRCPHAQGLWEAMAQVWQLPNLRQVMGKQGSRLEELILAAPSDTCRYIRMIAWRAWFARNEVTHEKPLPAIEGSRRFLCSYVNSLDNLRKLSTEEILKGKQPVQEVQPGSHGRVREGKRQPELDIAWEKPRTGMVKLNVDGSFMEQSGGAGAGMILRDAEGRIVFSACRALHHCGSALEAELGACMQGIALARQQS
jgi:hypothetical protein